MSIRSGLRAGFGFGALAGVLASSAAAVPLTYNVVVAESDITTAMSASAFVDLNPDLLNQFPQFGFLAGTSTTKPSTSSHAIADVGLPGGFDPVANGISISEMTFTTLLAPGVMDGFGAISVPLDLTGSNIQLIGYTAKVAALSITLDDPISSRLIAGPNAGEWLWAAPTANVTISGIIAPIVLIPTMDPITLDSFPFSQAVTMPLAGTFSGDASGTRLTLGIPIDALQNQSLELAPISVPLEIPGGLIPITGTFSLSGLTLADISTAVVYANATPVPEPDTALLLGLGLLALGMHRRR